MTRNRHKTRTRTSTSFETSAQRFHQTLNLLQIQVLTTKPQPHHPSSHPVYSLTISPMKTIVTTHATLHASTKHKLSIYEKPFNRCTIVVYPPNATQLTKLLLNTLQNYPTAPSHTVPLHNIYQSQLTHTILPSPHISHISLVHFIQ